MPAAAAGVFMPELYKLLSTQNTAVCWSADGSGIEVLNDAALKKHALPVHFPTANVQTWKRQMYRYGFKCSTEGKGLLVWTHPELTKRTSRADFVATRCKQVRAGAKSRASNHALARSDSSSSPSPQPQDEESKPTISTPSKAKPAVIVDPENFLVKLYRMSKNPMNDNVLAWQSDGRLAIRDPDALPGLLCKIFGTASGFYSKLEAHGFEWTPMRYAEGGRPVYAWKHSVLSRYSPEHELTLLNASAALKLAEDARPKSKPKPAPLYAGLIRGEEDQKYSDDADEDADADGDDDDDDMLMPMALPAVFKRKSGFVMPIKDEEVKIEARSEEILPSWATIWASPNSAFRASSDADPSMEIDTGYLPPSIIYP
ncbi:HSF-DOMAIN domain-containing protein [Mycena chlorophos]|uniref:HSF-DOMAIN domain-containing protein n=1 Tax=Mycena chlorophos TaxID=658473 RepID=A0A8H6SHN3_MYCCL|nr:HSF-DOMAIN domain-containing protein [Mycena chlorophos]